MRRGRRGGHATQSPLWTFLVSRRSRFSEAFLQADCGLQEYSLLAPTLLVIIFLNPTCQRDWSHLLGNDKYELSRNMLTYLMSTQTSKLILHMRKTAKPGTSLEERIFVITKDNAFFCFALHTCGWALDILQVSRVLGSKVIRFHTSIPPS